MEYCTAWFAFEMTKKKFKMNNTPCGNYCMYVPIILSIRIVWEIDIHICGFSIRIRFRNSNCNIVGRFRNDFDISIKFFVKSFTNLPKWFEVSIITPTFFIISRLLFQFKMTTFYIPTLWKLRKFTLMHFWQKFRESNSFTKEITK